MTHPRIVAACTIALCSLTACGNSPDARAPEPPRAENTAKTEEPAKPVEEPKAPEVAAEKLHETTYGSTRVVIEDCPFEAPVTAEKGDPIRSIARVKDRLYLADGSTDLRVYKIQPGCKLALDASVGQGGIVKAPSKIEVLSSGAGGVIASPGVGESTLIRDGKVIGPCGKNYVWLHPSGTWGLTSFANSTVNKITITGDKCSIAPWVLTDLGDAKKRVGPFTNVNSIGYLGDLALVGGVSATSPQRFVIAYDAEGKEKMRFGSEKSFDDDAFGWVHGVTECAPGICVADANYRAISIWSKDGKFVGRLKLDKALSLPMPWAQTLAGSEDGVYVGVSVREKDKPTTGRILRLAFPGS